MVIDAQALRKCGNPRWLYGHRCRGVQKVWISTMDIWSKIYRSTGCVIIHDEYLIIDAQELRKCGYPRSIYGHRCTGFKEVRQSKVVIWS